MTTTLKSTKIMNRARIKHRAQMREVYGRPEWGAEPGKSYFVITWDN